MARFSRIQVLTTLLEDGLVPLFYNKDVEVAKKIIHAVAAGGSRVLEFTNRGDGAFQVFSQLIPYFAEAEPQMIIGVGTVFDAPTAAMYINAGANFVISPISNPEVTRLCNRRRIPHMPACATTSEISAAEELGVEIVKITPARSLGGPEFVKDVLGFSPQTKVMPSGGIEPTAEDIKAWIKAGVACVGMGSKLISKQAVVSGDWDTITRNVAQTLAWVKEARGIEAPALSGSKAR